MGPLFWDIVRLTISIIAVLLLIYGIIWLFTNGPLGGIIKSIGGVFGSMFGGGGGGGGRGGGGISSIPIIGPILGHIPGL